MTISRYNTGFN